MEVMRMQTMWVPDNKIEVGDKIRLSMGEFGGFLATAQKVEEKRTLFMFDDCVAVRKMNSTDTNEGGYEKSELNSWLETEFLAQFPDDIRNRVEGLSIPSYGMMFGHDIWCCEVLEPDMDDQLPLMNVCKNQIVSYQNVLEWYWLRNASKNNISSAAFALVYNNGYANYYNASVSLGVRPIFWLVS